ncbi:peptidoglycan-binding domain-containing protein [Phaeobacter gallaeciensis]|uniref:peptidoglycan-binding domain-containing protein n=1 Tax=Phaeobacter gallaeciensis TaxID=60890 RepID=UPI00237EF2D8|nr:peptidoglycan-binding domain-containing protein [Phaeobacter gallaeciensis]MDE4142960.1 peptidoglycan-binding domain-containing protein [Phaeobacter gallaeciensis]MDE4151401.1 peptidoglycan-binding domain-containing protein [Phaeobacter gallaeciensis]MDE4155635.1 peptidoglycan-binding domain-containing protein [Phaeobacter gallaeciensis]MDE4231027.1 peptidoglycan-binding domain-containing protein [Phaeobacter gallaeciensis]MDE4260076.1 peptidoglycan-binding domain-containing protein [Phaeob
MGLIKLTRDDYKAIQTMLNAGGFNAGDPDGVWGNGSKKALRKFQEANGLSATGAPDRKTLKAMGLNL